jgi:hypothetical protein
MTTSDKNKSTASGAPDARDNGDQYANAAENDPNYTSDVHTVTESEADEAEAERNRQLAEQVTGAQGPHYNAHLDADGPGGGAVANERTDGKESPSFEERTGQSTETGRDRTK